MSDVFYTTRWRLIYLDGRYLDEARSGSTIMDRMPNPVGLHLITPQGERSHSVEIPLGYSPIFYRQRSITQCSNGEMGEAELDATVFGYGRAIDGEPEKELWIWTDGRAEDCPEEHIAPKSIEMQLAIRN